MVEINCMEMESMMVMELPDPYARREVVEREIEAALEREGGPGSMQSQVEVVGGGAVDPTIDMLLITESHVETLTAISHENAQRLGQLKQYMTTFSCRFIF
ncbi:hypothetical protein LIER_13797 [Lithospermum erythrorhizon]|uniref:Uncharacterized protein n=1 Tax=Lithospermum erythrorhizon TaxID=34254 RepID=A0AAV3Q203_LITER